MFEGQTGKAVDSLWPQDAGRPEELYFVDESLLDEAARNLCPALRQDPVNTTFGELRQGIGEIDMATAVRPAGEDFDARRNRARLQRKQTHWHLVCRFHQMRGFGDRKARVRHETDRGPLLKPRQPAGKLRVIGKDGPEADEYRIHLGAQQMSPPLDLGACDRSLLTSCGRDLPISRKCKL